MPLKLRCNSCDGVYLTSLDVRFTKSCDNNCPFCIEKNGISSMEQDVYEMIKTTRESKKDTVLILGGEPFLEPEKLLDYVEGIRDFKKKIYITTSLPRTFLSEKNTVHKILEQIDGLNISLNHISSVYNNKLFNASSNHNRIEIIESLCNYYKRFQNKIRVSINLVKGVIDTRVELIKTVKGLEKIGVKHVKINELQHVPELYVSFEDIMGIKLPAPYSTGCQTEINGYSLLNTKIKVTLKRACFLVEPSRKASFKDLIKILIKKIFLKKKVTCQVLYENGEISNGWKQKG